MDDEKILELFFLRDQQGIRELDLKYGKSCRSLSLNLVNSREDAEVCVNDAYLGMWNAIPPARPRPLLSCLAKIVRNLSLKRYWREEAAKRSGRYTVALQEIEDSVGDWDTPEAEMEAGELTRLELRLITTDGLVINGICYFPTINYIS